MPDPFEVLMGTGRGRRQPTPQPGDEAVRAHLFVVAVEATGAVSTLEEKVLAPGPVAESGRLRCEAEMEADRILGSIRVADDRRLGSEIHLQPVRFETGAWRPLWSARPSNRWWEPMRRWMPGGYFRLDRWLEAGFFDVDLLDADELGLDGSYLFVARHAEDPDTTSEWDANADEGDDVLDMWPAELQQMADKPDGVLLGRLRLVPAH